MSDDMDEALGMTSEDATHDADCEHFREVAMLAARVMQAEDEVDRLTEGIRDTVRRVAGLAAAAQRGEYGHPVAEVESLRAELDRERQDHEFYVREAKRFAAERDRERMAAREAKAECVRLTAELDREREQTDRYEQGIRAYVADANFIPPYHQPSDPVLIGDVLCIRCARHWPCPVESLRALLVSDGDSEPEVGP